MKLRKQDIDKLIDILQNKKKELESEQDNYIFEFIGAKERDEFVLPEKWAIKQNKEEINNYFNKLQNKHFYESIDDNQYFHNPPYAAHYRLNRSILESYTEITFEQFKKYVLNED